MSRITFLKTLSFGGFDEIRRHLRYLNEDDFIYLAAFCNDERLLRFGALNHLQDQFFINFFSHFSNKYLEKLLFEYINYPFIVRILLSQGVNPNAKSTYLPTFAIRHEQSHNIATHSRLNDADLPSLDGFNNIGTGYLTPLIKASENGYLKTIKLLIEYGANVQNIEGESSLIKALKYEHYLVVELLLKNNVNVNVMFENNRTPLMIATSLPNSYYFCLLLLNFGADPNITNNLGETALIYAVKNNAYYTVDLLIRWGAEINFETTMYRLTPVSIAIKNDHRDITELLLSYGARLRSFDTFRLPYSILEKIDQSEFQHSFGY